MTIDRMIELLKIEHECILRNTHGDCDRRCEDCELVQDDGDLHEMYENVIGLVEAQEPVKPKWGKGYAYCGKCGYKLHWIVDLNNFCPNCGQAVKWDG